MTLRPFLAAILCATTVGLSGCGTVEQDPLILNLQSLARQAVPTGGGGAAMPAQPPVITRAMIPDTDAPLMLLEYPRQNAAALLTVVGQNGPIQSWQGSENTTFNMTTRGVLRSTRGLGFDLMASDTSDSEAAVARRQSTDTDRVLVHLDGDVQEVRSTHRCHFRVVGPETITIIDRAVRVTRAAETCRYDRGTYENLYWIDSTGRAVRSLQWVEERLGHYRFTYID